MQALTTPDARLRHIRRWSWLAAPLIAIPLSVMLVLVRAPSAPWWLGLVIGVVATPFAGFFMAQALVSSVSDLLVARLGTREAIVARLMQRASRFAPAMSRAALYLEMADYSGASAQLDSTKPVDRKQPLFHLVTQRRAFLTGDPATSQRAIDALIAWRPKLRIGFHAEVARYHAFILVSALVTRGTDDPSVIAAAKRLRDDRDFEIRAYAMWLESNDAPAESDLLLAGSALARSVGREPIAQALELRAARLTMGERAPYRAG